MERRRRALAPATDPMAKAVRRRDKPRERWLLTRKTWKYMADAGRRLVPDGAQNRVEDLPRLEAYFQEVCAKEPKYVLWRKSSYPGAIPRPKRKKRARGGSVRARSPSDTPPPPRPTDLALLGHTSGGRFDIAKLRRDFFATPPPTPPTAPPPAAPDDEESTLVDLLRKYLKVEEDCGPARLTGGEELVKALRRFLARQAERQADRPADADDSRTLLDTLGRYYGRAPNRDHIVQDLLTDRGLLKRLYHDLRKTKPYRGGRSSGGGAGGYVPGVYGAGGSRGGAGGLLRSRATVFGTRVGLDADEARSPPLSPPPLIEVRGESQEERGVDRGTQTPPVPGEVLAELERQWRERQEPSTPTSPASPPPERRPARRRSSVDHDDVSQSVSDTIKRYLRMARKKSVDADKADRFKRINYDKNLRNIKPKGPCEGDDDGLNKGSQTDDAWMLTYRELRAGSEASSPPSPASPTAPHSFLSTLLGRPAPSTPALTTPSMPAGGMHKSRSSSSVVHSVSKRLWGTRSRSSSRAAATWTPQGSCAWSDGSGRSVRLGAASLLALSEVERRALQQAALARLHQLNLGTTIKIPDENAGAASSKPKRRAYLLKRKALTTGFFDQRTGKDGDKDKGEVSTGSVFGMPLSQCVETERALRRARHGGSRASLASLASLAAHDRPDDSESCDSGDWGSCVSEEGGAGAGGPRVPALVSACLAHLRRHGLHTLGLFRVSASKKRVRQLREEWERSQEAALDAAACPHDVATLLKEFLRDLPDPLLCRDLYSAFLHTQKIRNRRLQWEALRLVVALLPAAHRDTLSALLAFLAQLAAHADDDAREPGNKMDAANLATVFAPTILHNNKPNETVSAEQLSERADVINVVRALVERQGELWALPAELLHEAYLHLASAAPAALDSLLLRRAECQSSTSPAGGGGGGGGGGAGAAPEERRVWSREECLHTAAATGGPDHDLDIRRAEKQAARSRRAREPASDTSTSSSLSSARTLLTRVRSSVEESGVVSPPRDSHDDGSDYTETLCNSDSDSCVITASLHIRAAYPRAPPRRRSSGSEGAKRDSAVGSSEQSAASTPPSSPPPAAPRPLPASVASAASAADIHRLMSLARERNTSDARAVVVRQHDDVARARPRPDTRPDTRPEARPHARETTLYKRNELISSARTPPP